MTVKEAIDELKYSRDMCYFDPSTGETGKPYSEECERMAQALDIAIEALTHEPVGDCISRQAAIDFIKDHSYPVRYDSNSIEQGMTITGIEQALNEIPSARSEPISEAYAKAVWTWLINYQIKVAELKGRYTPYEVLSWVANDWRKEHE